VTRIALATVAAILLACAPYAQLAPGVREVLHPRCSTARTPEAMHVLAVVLDVARKAGALKAWPLQPPRTIELCVIESRPSVVCRGTQQLAGCTDDGGYTVRIEVPTHIAPRIATGDWTLREGYDWRRDVLVHELLSALTLVGALDLPPVTPANEAQWVQGALYRRLVAEARARL